MRDYLSSERTHSSLKHQPKENFQKGKSKSSTRNGLSLRSTIAIVGSDMSEDDKLDLIDAEYDDKERDRRLNEGEPTVD